MKTETVKPLAVPLPDTVYGDPESTFLFWVEKYGEAEAFDRAHKAGLDRKICQEWLTASK